jgi:hypothetical protein
VLQTQLAFVPQIFAPLGLHGTPIVQKKVASSGLLGSFRIDEQIVASLLSAHTVLSTQYSPTPFSLPVSPG